MNIKTQLDSNPGLTSAPTLTLSAGDRRLAYYTGRRRYVTKIFTFKCIYPSWNVEGA